MEKRLELPPAPFTGKVALAERVTEGGKTKDAEITGMSGFRNISKRSNS